jgi:acetyltransferase-like isoleucine patch superfamily enzyme
VVQWFVTDGQRVAAGDLLAEVETSKAVLEVVAPEQGVVLSRAPKGSDHPLTEPVALLFEDAAALEAFSAAERPTGQAEPAASASVRASAKAVARAAELGVDLAAVAAVVGDALITADDVERAHATAVNVAALPLPLKADEGVQRIVLIGGGLGATQVIDILAGSLDQMVVGIVDDSRTKWGTEVAGVPIVGGRDRLARLHADGHFDAAIISISTSVDARRRFREECAALEIPLANAIDRTAKIASDVQLGTGNVICAFSQLGTGVRMGDNNFLSAYNSFDHHNQLGSDISTGPGCMSSGLVRLGNQVRLGTGVFIEPHVELGDRVQVASGSVIVTSVPADHTVKTKVVTTVVVPTRRPA